MRKFTFILGTLLMTLLMASIASAKPQSYETSFQLANQSSTTANVVMTFYNQDGTVNSEVSDTIPGNGSKTYFRNTLGASAGFNGSVVVSSDQPVVAISNIHADSLTFGASYESFSAGSTSVNLPLIMRGNFGFDTWFNVQNTSTTDANVTISYSGQPSCDQTATIKPGAAATFDQSTYSCLGSFFVGAATISSSQPVVATVVQAGPSQILAYDGFITDGSTSAVMPLVMSNNFAYFTGIQVQNTGGSSTSVTISYTAGASGTDCSQTKTIAAGASQTFGAQDSCIWNQTFVGGASVTANTASQNLVAVVNQSNFNDKGSAYNAIDPTTGGNKVTFPLIMDQNFGYFTSINVQNVSNTNVTVNCSFVSSNGKTPGADLNFSLSPSEAFNHNQLGHNEAGFVGSASCTSTGGLIVGVVNELGTASPGDTFLTYGGFAE
ncbi:MAG: hypothetical protein QNJ45_09480 [Ardenticatenaceae bacterium]|nr:hypothetical protein [Ardenticatenaceae bacterium]